MKKKILLSFILFSLFSLSIFAEENTSGTHTVAAVMMQEGGAIWMQNQNGIMMWNASLPQGTKLEMYVSDQTDFQGNSQPLTVTAWTNSNGTSTKNTFTKVRYQNSDFYVISNRLSQADQPGKISVACAVYTKLDFLSVKNKSLPKDTFVCIGNTFSVAENIDFTEITYFDSLNFSTITAYVLAEKVEAIK